MLKLVSAVLASSVVCCGFLATAAEPEDSDAIPKSIKKLAAPRAEKAFSKAEDRERYIEGFAKGFKSGLTSPEGTVDFWLFQEERPLCEWCRRWPQGGPFAAERCSKADYLGGFRLH